MAEYTKTLNFKTHLLPYDTNSANFGSEDKRWDCLFSRLIKTSGSIFSGSTLYSGGKTSYNDGVPGAYIGHNGTVHLSKTGEGPYICFHYNNSVDYTSIIKEVASGYIQIDNKLGIGGKADNAELYVNGIIRSEGSIYTQDINKTVERQVAAVSGAGSIYLYAQGSNGNKGIYCYDANNQGKAVVTIYSSDNSIRFNGAANSLYAYDGGIDRLWIRQHSGTKKDTQNAIFIQADCDTSIVNVGIDGVGYTGVNQAKNSDLLGGLTKNDFTRSTYFGRANSTGDYKTFNSLWDAIESTGGVAMMTLGKCAINFTELNLGWTRFIAAWQNSRQSTDYAINGSMLCNVQEGVWYCVPVAGGQGGNAVPGTPRYVTMSRFGSSNPLASGNYIGEVYFKII